MTQTCDLLDRVQTPAARVAASCERQHRRSPTRVFRRPCPVTVVIVIIIETRIPSEEKDNDRNGQGFRGWELACISQRAENEGGGFFGSRLHLAGRMGGEEVAFARQTQGIRNLS